MKLEKQACMLALAAILLLIVGAFVVGFPAGATLAEETDIDLNAFEGSVILDDPVYFQEATPDEPEVKPTQQPTIEPTQAPGEQPTVEPTHEPTAEPAADAQVIAMAMSIFNRLGLADDIEVSINSIGCPTCRAKYYDALRSYFAARKDELCDTCQGRLERNPMRILDCKSPVCQEIAKDAPAVTDYLCDECREHFDKVQSYLKAQNIDYTVNSRIVRGLDYYTKTVFEFVSDSIGAQGTVCGGGRYDGLIDELGGQKTPSLGFAVGLERLQLLMEAQGCAYPEPEKADLFIIALGDKATGKALELAGDMRSEGFAVLMDLNQRSLRAQMKYANKLGARYTVVLGDNEVDTDRVQLKAMDTGEETEVALSTFVNGFYSVSMQAQLADLEINGEAFDFTSLFQTGETE